LRPWFCCNFANLPDPGPIPGTAGKSFPDCAFPAVAARNMGLSKVPLLCAREIPVVGSMPSVVRILMHFHTELGLREVTHVYLDGAERLRDDIDGAS